MTLLGKILVFVNLGLSLLFAAWAFVIYMHPLEAKDPEYTIVSATPKYDVSGKNLDLSAATVSEDRLKQQDAMTRLLAARRQGEDRWQSARTTLARLEGQRPIDQRWYAEQLKILETGTDLNGKPPAGFPVVALEHDPNGRLILNRGNRPIQFRSQPVQPITWYNDPQNGRYAQLQDQIKNEQNRLQKLIEQEKELTLQLNGDPGKFKGLRQLLAEEDMAQHNSLAEQEALQPILLNRLAEAQLLLKRQNALIARIKELKKVGVVAGEKP